MPLVGSAHTLPLRPGREASLIWVKTTYMGAASKGAYRDPRWWRTLKIPPEGN